MSNKIQQTKTTSINDKQPIIKIKTVGLIVPDVHEKIFVLKQILRTYKDVDWVVFLGDFMDCWDGFTPATEQTVKWLAENIKNPKYFFIWGNHDIHYAFRAIEGSGFDLKKLDLVRTYLDDTHWNKFKFIHWIESPNNYMKNFLCSHAGIHPSLLHPIKGFDKIALEELCDDALWKLKYAQMVTNITACGKGRGGWAKVGGLIWLDWETEFVPIDGLNQILGHSYGPDVRQKNSSLSTNYCIDTALNHVIEVKIDGSLKIVKV